MKWYLFVCLLGFVPAVAAGQTSTGVDAQLFRPPATSAGLLGVDEGDIPSHLSTSFGLFTHWTRTPVQLRTTSDELSSGPLISNLVGSDLQGSLGLWDLFEVGFAIPVTLYRSGATSLPGTPALSSTGLGDVRVGIRGVPLRMDLGPGQLLLGVTAGLALPTGDSNSFGGTPGGALEPRLMGEFHTPRYAVVLDVGGRLRRSVNVLGNEIGSAATLGLGGRMAVGSTNLDLNAALQGEIHGGAQPVALELLAGVRYRFEGISFSLGMGRGLTDGIGTPALRFLAGIQVLPDADAYWSRYLAARAPAPAPAPQDSDGDGFVDARDACPREAGVEPDGCPADPDGDGVRGVADACPTEPGTAAQRGCPNTDADGDTVADFLDRCPREFGTLFNQGCPETDGDTDGFVDRLDKCPEKPETFNGVEDEDGCPDEGQVLVVLTHDQIEIRQPVQFSKLHYGTAKWAVDQESFRLLQTVATVLKLHPELMKVEIQGHTDSQGGRMYNENLSELRAAAVRDHLVTVHRISPDRLSSRGFAYDKPIAPNVTEEGRARNRRVEFHITLRAEQLLQGTTQASNPAPDAR